MHKMQICDSAHSPIASLRRHKLHSETTCVWRLKQSPNPLGSGEPGNLIQNIELHQSNKRSHVENTVEWEPAVSGKHFDRDPQLIQQTTPEVDQDHLSHHEVHIESSSILHGITQARRCCRFLCGYQLVLCHQSSLDLSWRVPTTHQRQTQTLRKLSSIYQGHPQVAGEDIEFWHMGTLRESHATSQVSGLLHRTIYLST